MMSALGEGHERNKKFVHNKIEFRFTVLIMSVQGLDSDPRWAVCHYHSLLGVIYLH